MTPNIQFNRGAIDAGGAISMGWEMVKANYGIFLGVALLATVLSGCIPCVSLFILGPVLAGVYYFALRLYAGEPVDCGMMFKGFEKFVPLMVIGIVYSIPEVIGQGLRFGVQLGNFGLNSQRSGRNGQFFQSAGDPNIFAGIAAGVLVLVAIVAVVVIMFAIVWRFLLFFAIPLAMDRDLGAIDAMKLSAQAAMGNIGGILVLFFFEFLVSLLGVIMCGIGVLLVSIPIIYAANAIAYRMVFPKINDQFNYNPPSPGAYQGSWQQPAA
jgi:uncharacterized membrane protein